jgi:hypothetical protein
MLRDAEKCIFLGGVVGSGIGSQGGVVAPGRN